MRAQKQNELIKCLSDITEKCRKITERDNSDAKAMATLLEKTIKTISEQINQKLELFQSGALKNENLMKIVNKQLWNIQDEFGNLPKMIREKSWEFEKTTFSITVFGRTQAGKSTLMEILTHGSGASIGKGAQRTTRDVRTYVYQGLEITDVPGIAAFEGKDDEMIAMEAAAKSNLILFLLTGDAPQAEEAECLKQLLELGKPVIFIVNIKASIDQNGSLESFEKDLQRRFNQDRLETIRNQFLEFGRFWGQDWHSIRFAYVHLKSAFLSQQTGNEEIREQLYEASRFADVENLIIDEIYQNGSFYKLKNFSDGMVVPILTVMEELFRQSAENWQIGSDFKKNRENLKKWTTAFLQSGQEKFDGYIQQVFRDLKYKSFSFVEDNYENPKAGQEWEKIIKDSGIEKGINDLLIQLNKECEEKINCQLHKKIGFKYEKFISSDISGEKIFDTKKIIGWGAVILKTALSLASIYLTASSAKYSTEWRSPINFAKDLVSNGESFLSSCCDDKQEKIKEAKKNMKDKIEKNLNENMKNLRLQIDKVFKEEIINKKLWNVIHEIDKITFLVFDLARIQYSLAVQLNDCLLKTNMNLVYFALDCLHCPFLKQNILKIARIPGIGVLLLLKEGEMSFSLGIQKLSDLLKEKIWFVINTENIQLMLMQSIWSGEKHSRIGEINTMGINNIIPIVHIPFVEISNHDIQNRVRLAQQLTKLLITK